MSRQAIGRDTDAASELESFLDDNSDDLSSNLFDGLEGVAESIDKIVGALHVEVDRLETTIEELQEKIDSLEAEKE